MNRHQSRAAILTRGIPGHLGIVDDHAGDIQSLREQYYAQLRDELPPLPLGWEWIDASPEMVMARRGESSVTLTSTGALRVRTPATDRPTTTNLEPELIVMLGEQLAREAQL